MKSMSARGAGRTIRLLCGEAMTELIEVIIYSEGKKTTVLVPAELSDVPLYELAAAGLIYLKRVGETDD